MAVMVRKKFIGCIAALAVAVTAIGASSAQAEQRFSAEGALAALLGLAIVGAVINDRKDDKRRERERQAEAAKKKAAKTHTTLIQPRPVPQRAARHLVLPGECLRRYDRQGGGQFRILGQRCMDRNYQHARSLPRACERVLDTPRGIRRGWSARCLRREGYQLAAR